jgi:hypothetical protein
VRQDDHGPQLLCQGYALTDCRQLGRAIHCEGCDLQHGAWGWRDGQGGFHKVNRRMLRDAGYLRPPFVLPTADRGELRIIEIVLAAAHQDHVRSNCAPANLRAWCQRCHVVHDVAQHRRTAAATRRRAMETADLFA